MSVTRESQIEANSFHIELNGEARRGQSQLIGIHITLDDAFVLITRSSPPLSCMMIGNIASLLKDKEQTLTKTDSIASGTTHAVPWTVQSACVSVGSHRPSWPASAAAR